MPDRQGDNFIDESIPCKQHLVASLARHLSKRGMRARVQFPVERLCSLLETNWNTPNTSHQINSDVYYFNGACSCHRLLEFYGFRHAVHNKLLCITLNSTAKNY